MTNKKRDEPGLEEAMQHLRVGMQSKPIYREYGKSDAPWIDEILEMAFDDGREASSQSFDPGTKALPFDVSAAKKLMVMNSHHSACIRAKNSCTVGMGFVPENAGSRRTSAEGPAMTMDQVDPVAERRKRSKASQVLDAKCIVSFQDVINDVDEEVWQVGNGYMEVVRPLGEPEGEIKGIYHAPAQHIRLRVEDDGLNWHYEEVGGTRGARKFARFGDLADFRERMQIPEDQRVGEIIHFRQSSSLHRWYGFPDWLAAVSAMELSKALHQHTHDFFLNRGVPEFILFLLGKKIDGDNWKKIETSLRAHIGLGNSHKSMALNLTDPEMKVQLEKLALEGKTDSKDFSMLSDALALEVVSAHGVPPLLGGIQIPGKLGASNELPNALRAFQLLIIGPAQNARTTTLDCTLGNPELNGGLGLQEGDFLLRTITDELDLEQMAVSSQMRQTEPEAAAEGRDLSEGLRKELRDRDISKEDLAKMLGDAWAVAAERVVQTLLAA